MKEHLASQTWHLSRLGLKFEDRRRPKPEPPPAALVAQYNRTELYEKVWSEPMRNVAKQYGVSDVWLGKVCKVLQVPVPGTGLLGEKKRGKSDPKATAVAAPSIMRDEGYSSG